MVEIIGVKFNNAGKAYYFDPKGIQAKVGEHVLAETAHGLEMGKVVIANRMVEDGEIVAPLKPIQRLATEADFKQVEENKEKEKEAFALAVEKIAEHKLDMKLVDAEYTFDRSKILFYFTADGRVDFRELVKSLAGVFRTRIELRQIGVRDEARQLGSYGICGRYLCCSGFLNDFHPVSIKMAKEQGLSLNPTKISGVCGRLMCCLQYEQNAYEDMLARLPKKGEKVATPDGDGIVADVATLKGNVRVRFQEGEEAVRFENYPVGQLRSLAGRKWDSIPPESVVEEEIDSEPVAMEEQGEAVSEVMAEDAGEKKPENSKQEKNQNKNNNHKRRNRNRRKPSGERKSEQKQNSNVTKQKQEKPEKPVGNGGYGSGY
ncbi:MAG: stage 0 sporulation family protein [Clostridia bacterium]|nr:stage 0 sporulation family protein [Clostridia bacterium]